MGGREHLRDGKGTRGMQRFMVDLIRPFLLLLVLFQPSGALGQTDEPRSAIAFSRLTEGYWQIWTQSLEGGQQRQITYSKQDKRDATWSNDGREIAYRTHNGQLFLVSLDKGTEREIMRNLHFIHGPSWSPARDEIVMIRIDPHGRTVSEIWKSDRNGEEATVLMQATSYRYQPAWSPAGNQIAFVQLMDPSCHQLWIINADGSNPRQITTTRGLHVHPSFTPDGQMLVYASNEEGQFEVYRISVSGGPAQRLTVDSFLDTDPCVSPRGDLIYFVSNRTGNRQIWKMGMDGSNPELVTVGNDECLDPACFSVTGGK